MREGVGRALRRAIGRDDVLSRIKPRRGGVSQLMNEKRRILYQHLLDKPLIHLRELARETDMPVGTVDWHLKNLIDAKVVSSYSGKKKSFFYPTGWIVKDDLASLSTLTNETTRAILGLVCKNPGLSQTDIARKLGKYQQYVQPRISSLENTGFLKSETFGRRKVYQKTEKLEDMVKTYDQRSQDFVESIIQMLRDDGLNPRIQSKSKSVTKVKLDDGKNVFYLRIRVNPVSTIMES